MDTKNLTVCKANQVIEAGYRLTLNEQRVVLACIAQVDSREALLVTDKFELTAKDFATLFSVSDKHAYNSLIEVTDSLFNRYIVIDNPFPDDPKAKRLKTRWISSIIHYPNEGKIVLRFAQDMLPYLSELKRCFTQYKLEHIGKMTSIYAIRLYELLMQWQDTGKREIEIDWLKRQFDLDVSYSRMFDLKKYVIDPAVKDINAHSNLKVTWTQRKTGRRVTHLTFKFSEKASEAAEKSQKATTKAQAKQTTAPTEKMIYGVAESEIIRLAKAGESWESAAARIKRERAAQK